MAADVVFTAEEPWYTSSGSWYRIVELAMPGLEAPAREEYGRYAGAPLGIDFTTLPDGKAAEVARWLSGAVGAMLAAGAGEGEAHLRELVRRLRSEIQVREPEGSARPSG